MVMPAVKLDPRTKLIMVVCLSTLALIYQRPGQLFLLLAGTVVLLQIFRVRLNGIWGYLKRFFPLFLILFFVQSIFSPGGETLLAVGPLPVITGRGLAVGTSVVLRMGVVIAAALLLTTVSSRDFVLGLVQGKVPYEIAFMVFVTIRFLPVFREELNNVIIAVQLRGVELKKVSRGQKIELYRRLFFPVVYGAVVKARQLAIAMEARGFRAYPRRTYLRWLDFNFTDYLVIIFFLAVTLMLMGWHMM